MSRDGLAGAEGPHPAPLVPDAEQLGHRLASGCSDIVRLDADLRPCVEHIAALARRLSGAAYGLVSLLEPSGSDGAVRRACQGPAGEVPQHEALLQLGAQGILQRHPLVVGNTLADPRWRHHRCVQAAPHVRFLLSLPLIAPDGRVLGHLSCLDPEPRPLPDPRLSHLTHLAALVVRLQERRRLRQLLAITEAAEGMAGETSAPHLLQCDQLTQMLESGFRLGLQSGYAVLRCEIKDHDRLCATHGSPFAAVVLEEVSHRLLQALPPGASAARFTDAEFLVVLPQVSREAVAAGTARRLIDQLNEAIHTHDLAIPITLAIGIVMVQPHHASAGSVLADAAIARRLASRSLLSQFCFLDAKSRRDVREDYALETRFREIGRAHV